MHALIILSLRLKGDPLQISGTIWSFFFSSTLLCEHYKLLCLGLSGFSTLSSQLRKTFWVLASPEAWELFPGSKLVSLEGSLLCLPFSGVIILCSLRSSVWKPLLCLFCCSCVVLYCLFFFRLSPKASSCYYFGWKKMSNVFVLIYSFTAFFKWNKSNICVCVTLIGNDIKITSRRIWGNKS